VTPWVHGQKKKQVMQSDTIADLHEQLEHERAEVKRHKEEARKNEYKVFASSLRVLVV
jgi:hypothetical protein